MKHPKKLYTIAFIVGTVFTPLAIHSAYIQRGYFAIGGEYLIIPFMLLLTNLINSLIDSIKAIKKALV